MKRLALAGLLIGLAAVAAQAAESRRGFVPANRCAAYGPGYVYAAQTGACVRLSGHVRADARAHSGGPDVSSLRGEGRLRLDARSETGAGPLRAVIDVRGHTGGFPR